MARPKISCVSVHADTLLPALLTCPICGAQAETRAEMDANHDDGTCILITYEEYAYAITWDEHTVKTTLPNVTVRIGQTLHNGQTSGRLERFAVVTLTETGLRITYAWSTIAHSLNTGNPLTI